MTPILVLGHTPNEGKFERANSESETDLVLISRLAGQAPSTDPNAGRSSRRAPGHGWPRRGPTPFDQTVAQCVIPLETEVMGA